MNTVVNICVNPDHCNSTIENRNRDIINTIKLDIHVLKYKYAPIKLLQNKSQNPRKNKSNLEVIVP